jgi:RNA polymerase sigma factor (TIGR02999 family)
MNLDSISLRQVTEILKAAQEGDPQAAEQLLPLVYDELRKLAAARLAQESPGQTLQATALVHEAYLRLVGNGDEPCWDSRGHFFAAAAESMRRILVEQARRKAAPKHGGQLRRLDLNEVSLAVAAEELARDERDRAIAAKADAEAARNAAAREKEIAQAMALAEKRATRDAASALEQAQQARQDTEQALKETDTARLRSEAISHYLMEVFRAPKSDAGFETMQVWQFLDRAAAKLETEFAGDPKLKADLLTALGHLYLFSGSAYKARAPLEKALAIQRAAFGLEHPDTLMGMNSLAEVYVDRAGLGAGDYKKAISLLEEMLPLQQAKLGREHRDTLTTMFRLALACQSTGEPDRAVPLHEEALRLRKATLGAEHADTVESMHRLAQACFWAGKVDQAIPLFEETLRLQEATADLEAQFTRVTLALAYQVIGKLDRAVSLFEQNYKRYAAEGRTQDDRVASMSSRTWIMLAAGYTDRNERNHRDSERLSAKGSTGPQPTVATGQ